MAHRKAQRRPPPRGFGENSRQIFQIFAPCEDFGRGFTRAVCHAKSLAKPLAGDFSPQVFVHIDLIPRKKSLAKQSCLSGVSLSWPIAALSFGAQKNPRPKTGEKARAICFWHGAGSASGLRYRR